MTEPARVFSMGTTAQSASSRITASNISSNSRLGQGSMWLPRMRRAASSEKAPRSPWKATRVRCRLWRLVLCMSSQGVAGDFIL